MRAELSATVWQVRAAVGEPVVDGDPLVVLESMKMEIPVVAPVAGTVTELRVAPDDRVEEGDVVAVIETNG
ncbi:biotin/lipoyl-binding carrier protein [soil metagenome]